MTAPLRLRIHINEPFDFERENVSAELFGATLDHDGELDEWQVELDDWFTLHKTMYDVVLLSPRYVGEHLERVHDAILGVAVRIAHRTEDGWHYAMAGMMSIVPPDPDEDDDSSRLVADNPRETRRTDSDNEDEI